LTLLAGTIDIRGLGYKTAGTTTGETPHGVPVVLVVVVRTWVDVRAVEVQVVGVVGIVGGSGPIVAVATTIVGRGIIEVPRVHEILKILGTIDRHQRPLSFRY